MTTGTRSAISMLTDFFASDAIEAAARRTGFVKRTSKLTGKLFLALVTFGAWSDATTTLAQLAAKVTQLDEQVEVSSEAIHQRTLVHALMDGFRRHLHLLVQLRHLRRQLRQRGGGVTPGPKGDEGQKQFAGQLRRAFDKAGATRGSFDSVGRKEVC